MGAYGGQSPLSRKIEMFYYGKVKCSYHKKHNDINNSKQLLDRNCI